VLVMLNVSMQSILAMFKLLSVHCILLKIIYHNMYSKHCFHRAPVQFQIVPKLLFQKLVRHFLQCIHDTKNERV